MLALVLTWLACTGHGHRARLAESHVQVREPSSLEKIALLLVASKNPTSGWLSQNFGVTSLKSRHTSRTALRMMEANDVAEEERIRKAFGDKASDRHTQDVVTSEDAAEASFEDAQVIGRKLAKVLTESCVAGEPMPEEAVTLLKSLVSTMSGARGWFVTLLTDPDYEPLFQPPIDETLLKALCGSQPNIKLMTMNVAMSTATRLAHLERGNKGLAEASGMTSDRSKALLVGMLSPGPKGEVRMPGLREELEGLLAAVEPDAEAADSGASTNPQQAEWLQFCKKWGYNSEHRKAIHSIVSSILQ